MDESDLTSIKHNLERAFDQMPNKEDEAEHLWVIRMSVKYVFPVLFHFFT